MSIHVHRVPTKTVAHQEIGVRWCFRCRAHRRFFRTIYAPVDRMSYYGPHAAIACLRGHENGDLFPGRIREWSDVPA